MPRWANLLGRGEPSASVGELNKATLILVLVVQVLVVPVAVFVRAHVGSQLVAETSLLVSGSVWLTAQHSAHETLLPVELPKLRAHHSDGHTPRSHFLI